VLKNAIAEKSKKLDTQYGVSEQQQRKMFEQLQLDSQSKYIEMQSFRQKILDNIQECSERVNNFIEIKELEPLPDPTKTFKQHFAFIPFGQSQNKRDVLASSPYAQAVMKRAG